MADRQLVLVTSDGCHFCDRAHEVLAELGIPAREIDFDSSEAHGLAEAGVPLAFLPVLLDGNRVVAYGRFSEKRLRRELADRRRLDGGDKGAKVSALPAPDRV